MRCRRVAAIAALAMTGFATTAGAQEWQHTAILYGMGAAIDGESTIGDLSVPVDLSMSDVFDALEFGVMGAYRADNGTWSFTGDLTYMGLGATPEGPRGLVRGDVEIDQLTLMGSVGRRMSERFEAQFSLAYFDLSADLELRTTDPLTGQVTRRTAGTDADWVDPLVGLSFEQPFADAWQLLLRGDIGGFGIGSDLTYHLLATLHWQSAGGFGAGFGYRMIAFDYEDGNKGTRSYQRFDLTEQGPLLGVTYRF